MSQHPTEQGVPEVRVNGESNNSPLVFNGGLIPNGSGENEDLVSDSKSRFQVQRVPSVRGEKPKPVALVATNLLKRHANANANTYDARRNTLTFGGATTYHTRHSLGSMGSNSDIYSGQLSPYATYHSQLNTYDSRRESGQLSPTGTNVCKTFGRDTQEALPHVDHYRNLMSAITAMKQRPTLTELHEEQVEVSHKNNLIEFEVDDKKNKGGKSSSGSGGVKFGWIQGVLVRCLLNIFGVMLFLRLSWVTGQAGIGLASVIILLSAVVTVLTTMSMSAICTNGEVKGGGAYYMISRSLGPEFGGAIGIVFSLANAIAAAMYVVGFAETVVQLMEEYDKSITGNPLNDIRLIGCVTSVFLLGIVVIGMEWESKAQLGLLFILLVAILNFVIGTFIPPTPDKRAKGVTGYSGEVFVENFSPDFRGGEGFFSVFSVFFPAATGILAGANISGDLKDPQKAIPKGTFLAILLTTIVYLMMAWMCGSVLLRDAAGPIEQLVDHMNMTSLGNQTTLASNMTDWAVNATISSCSAHGPKKCDFGSINYNYSVGLISGFRPLILAGIFAATLSSALASLVSAPKVFQAVGKDRLFPGTNFFAKEYGKSREPIRGYVLTFGISIAVTCIAELNVIAPIISNFFLMAYTLINFSCFDASLAKSPGFRPAFKFYNKWLSLLGAILCLAVMFVINWWAALVTFVVVGALYLYIRQAKPDVNWGSSGQAHAYQDALKTCQKLVTVEEHVKNFRPQILVLSGNPENRPDLVEFASAITKRQSLLLCGHVLEGELSDHLKHLRSMASYSWFRSRKIKAFYYGVAANSLRQGAQVLLQITGLGKLRPNTLMLGYKTDWQTDEIDMVDQYFNIIHDAFDLHYGVGVFRVPGGFDIKKVTDDVLVGEDSLGHETYHSSDEDEETEAPSSRGSSEAVDNGSSSHNRSSSRNGAVSLSGVVNPSFHGSERLPTVPSGIALKNMEEGVIDDGVSPCPLPEDSRRNGQNDDEDGEEDLNLSLSENRFRAKQEGTIDVWWLFDDGGLTLLVPYILSTRASWKNCQLRVFCVGTKQANINEDQRRMATLLNKFRIDFSQLTVIADLGSKPRPETTEEYETMMAKWKLGKDESSDDKPWMISDAEFLAHKAKTNRHLKLREHLLTHSKKAALIVMTLPIPKKATTSAALYMSWLEVITKDMPPILLLRGNQQDVLTFYS
ncbi:solute carrier family 12 member 1-like [Liolophura sinensis]|uniref:solute carrier family 12 member 1-like n=1 Tax=Liolophura sinensis TaxID=3198878 RepID=UPI0031585F93